MFKKIFLFIFNILNNIFIFFRSLLFTILFLLDTLTLALFISFGRLIFMYDRFRFVSRIWTKTNIFLLKYICGVKYKVIGEENIPNYNCLIVSKHQSTWETYFLFQYFKKYPIFVVKKELLSIPGIGTSLKNVGCIAIDRKDGIHSIKKVEEQSKKILENDDRHILIFPQGTRVPVDSNTNDYPYKGGFLGIAKVNNLDILPIALNSGKCWPKGSFMKKPGTIEVKFMPVIKHEDYKDMKKTDILKLIEDTIENAQKTLN